jgi:hypothetical protein
MRSYAGVINCDGTQLADLRKEKESVQADQLFRCVRGKFRADRYALQFGCRHRHASGLERTQQLRAEYAQIIYMPQTVLKVVRRIEPAPRAS